MYKYDSYFYFLNSNVPQNAMSISGNISQNNNKNRLIGPTSNCPKFSLLFKML